MWNRILFLNNYESKKPFKRGINSKKLTVMILSVQDIIKVGRRFERLLTILALKWCVMPKGLKSLNLQMRLLPWYPTYALLTSEARSILPVKIPQGYKNNQEQITHIHFKDFSPDGRLCIRK
jgi:hypothetical protein